MSITHMPHDLVWSAGRLHSKWRVEPRLGGVRLFLLVIREKD